MGSISNFNSNRIIFSINETYLHRKSGFNHKLCCLNPHCQFPCTRIATSMNPTFTTGKQRYHPEASIATLFLRNSFSETIFADGIIRGSSPLIPMFLLQSVFAVQKTASYVKKQGNFGLVLDCLITCAVLFFLRVCNKQNNGKSNSWQKAKTSNSCDRTTKASYYTRNLLVYY